MAQEKTYSMTIPPPVLGWNTKDPISQMDALYSPGIENYFPDNGVVSLRNGYATHVKTTAASYYSAMFEYVNNAGTHFLIAMAEGDGLSEGAAYNVTAAGTGTAITGGFTTKRPENYAVNFKGRLYIKAYFSGANSDILSTDGTAATLPGFAGPGGDDKDLWRLTTYKGAFYALAISDASMWNAANGAVTGAMSQWDWQTLLVLGGQPWYIGGFSMTGGDITQEYFCMISEQGEVYLYQGDSPQDTTWAAVGHFFIPAPAGRQSFFKWGSDILIVTYEGLISLREYIGTAPGEDYTYLSDNIAGEFKGFVTGTDLPNMITGIVYPKGQYLLINFVQGSTSTAVQLVMNTQTRAWTKFTGQNSFYWSLLSNSLYWCGRISAVNIDGYVAKADTGDFDENPDSAGAALTRTTKLRCAFNYLQQDSMVKILTECVPILYESENLSLTLNADVDYSDDVSISLNSTTGNAAYKLYRPRCGLKASPGKAISIRLDGTVTTKRRSIQAFEVFWKDGDIR